MLSEHNICSSLVWLDISVGYIGGAVMRIADWRLWLLYLAFSHDPSSDFLGHFCWLKLLKIVDLLFKRRYKLVKLLATGSVLRFYLAHILNNCSQ